MDRLKRPEEIKEKRVRIVEPLRLSPPPPQSSYQGYSYTLEEKLTAGTSVFIEGKINEKCSSFVINFHVVEENIALHINPRFDQRYIARNAKIHKKWGAEESQLLGAIPFDRGDTFFLEILISPTEYLTSVNGQHIFNFPHRLPYQDVKVIKISPDVVISKFLVSHPVIYPSKPLTPLELPLTRERRCPIHASLEPLQIGDVIQVVARVDSLPYSFYINLQAGFHQVPHPIITYHMVVRYIPSWTIVQNTWSNGKWNEEITEKIHRVLLPGETVHIHIRCQPNGYVTNISGKQLKLLPYRVPLSASKALVLMGDLKVISIKTSAESNPSQN